MGKFIDLTDQYFGRWHVLEFSHMKKTGAVWKCECECGTIKEVEGRSLRNGTSYSCGCFQKEVVAEISKGNEIRTTHDMSRTRLYKIWVNMKYRCSPTCAKHFYDLYYGRGIRVCAEWKNDFSVFAKWALSNGYSDELSIDRINNDGDYEPSNCRWVSDEVQANNKSTSKFITYNGETLTAKQWSKKLNITYDTIMYNLSRGRTLEDVVKKRDL